MTRMKVAQALEQAKAERGRLPGSTTVDNGSEFSSRALFYRYRIALGETDAVSPCPMVNGSFIARFDRCGKEADYNASDVIRFEFMS